MTLLNKVIRPSIRDLKPYSSARLANTGGDASEIVFLDAAEAAYSPFDLCGDSDSYQGSDIYRGLNSYPEPQPQDLLNTLSGLYGVAADQILVTRGSEEGIRLLMQLFCAPVRGSVITCPPCFALYPVEADIHGAGNIVHPRLGTGYDQLDIDRIVQSAQDADVNLLLLSNPCNPISTQLSHDHLVDLISALADDCIVVVDEAYIEYSSNQSSAALIDRYPNLVVLRTLSKAYGLAGLRCGSILASAEIIDYLKRITLPYSVPLPVQKIAVQALSDDKLAAVQAYRDGIIEQRGKMLAALGAMQGQGAFIKKLFPSVTNFLSLQVSDAERCVRVFRDNGLFIRNRSAALDGLVTLAVSTSEVNDKVLKIFNSL